MGQKFFISFNSADGTKAHWIAWTLKKAEHEVAVYDWEVRAGDNVPLWMNKKLAWADRLIAVISPDYLPARYSPVEWASQIWNDPDGTKGAVIPVIVRPTPKIPPLLNSLSRIDLTNCSEAEAKSRLLRGVDMPEPTERKPAFEKVYGEAPDSQHAGPVEKPIFIPGNVKDGLPIAPESLASIIRDHARQASVEINAPLERVWHLIDDDDARQTWDQDGLQIYYLTERKSTGTRFVARQKSMLFKVILQGTIHAYLPPRAMSLRLDLASGQTHVFYTLLLSRNGKMTSVESYRGISSEVKYLAFFFRWFFFFFLRKGERQNLERLKAAAEAQQLE